VARAKDWLLAGLVLLLGKAGGGHSDGEHRIIPKRDTSDRAERLALLLLGLSSLSAIAFVVIYLNDTISSQTQFLGLTLGLALLFFAAALVVVGK
jgi:hypothetical protein